MHPLPRISPDAPIQYKEWTIPAGVGIPEFPGHNQLFTYLLKQVNDLLLQYAHNL